MLNNVEEIYKHSHLRCWNDNY